MQAKPHLRVPFEIDDHVFRLGDLARYSAWLACDLRHYICFDLFCGVR